MIGTSDCLGIKNLSTKTPRIKARIRLKLNKLLFILTSYNSCILLVLLNVQLLKRLPKSIPKVTYLEEQHNLLLKIQFQFLQRGESLRPNLHNSPSLPFPSSLFFFFFPLLISTLSSY